MNFESFVSGLDRLRRGGPGLGPDDVLVLPTVDSTNRFARVVADGFEKEAEALPSFLVFALEQTAGRGRRGRSWSSPAGRGVYASRVLAVEGPEQLGQLPLLAGLGLLAGLAAAGLPEARLKWPNDLVVEVEGRRRKVGGVLIESWTGAGGGTAACIGFGVNLSHAAEELPEPGISLHALGLTGLDLPGLAWALTRGLEAELRHLSGAVAEAGERYRALSVHRPGERMVCRVGETELAGTFQGFDEAGRLRLSTGNGERVLAAGEVIEG